VARKSKFLVHFDDVGAFEKNGIDLGRDFLYRIWHIGEALRCDGHFYVMTGRSTQLHNVGISTGERKLGEFVSPTNAVMIRLPPLSFQSLCDIFTLNKSKLASPLVVDDVVNIDAMHVLYALTSGVPRAIHAAFQFYAYQPYATIEQIEEVVRMKCVDNTMMNTVDVALHHKCL
jgi:hypothetical protein